MSLFEDDSSLARIEVPRVAVLGMTPGAGVSTVVLGLLVAYKKQGIAVSGCKLGPSLVEPTHHRRISGRLSPCLDPWMLDREQIIASFARSSSGAELILIEGQHQMGVGGRSDAPFDQQVEVASALRAPVILVVDARGYDENLRVVLEELLHRYPALELGGVAVNFVRDAHHERKLRSAVKGLGGVLFIGAMLGEPADQFVGKASIALNRNTSLLTRNQLIRLGNLVDSVLDLELIRQIAGQADMLEVPPNTIAGERRRCRVAVADDQAFHLTIQDNLELIRRAGGELVPFSPLIDQSLPANTKAIYLPSGYLHLYAPDIALNVSMLRQLRQFAENGGVIYAEGSALAYMCNKITFPDGDTLEMAGVLPGTGLSRHGNAKPPAPVYTELHALTASPLTAEGTVLRGFRNTRWQLRVEGNVRPALEVVERSIEHIKGSGERVWREGILATDQVFCTGVHIHWGSAPEAAQRFIEAALASSV